jgi:hypothetical protein
MCRNDNRKEQLKVMRLELLIVNKLRGSGFMGPVYRLEF